MPEVERLQAALVAAEEFARRNFPKEGRLRGVTAYEDLQGSSIIIGGGVSDRVHEPGMYLVYDEARWYGSGIITDSRIESGEQLWGCSIDHARLLERLERFLDF